MPSYRVTVTIGALRPGTRPESVLPAAARAAAESTTVEASDLAIVSGMPRITVRFTADDAGHALRIGEQVVASTSSIAETLAWKVTERIRGRWYVVR